MKPKARALLGVLAGLTLVWVWLLARPSDFWNRAVSFSCSYVPPSYSQVIYTEMHYSDGQYRVVLQDLSTGLRRILSDKDSTAIRGVAANSSFLYQRLRGNVTEHVWRPEGSARPSLSGEAFGRFVPNVALPVGEGALVAGQLTRETIGLFHLRDGRVSTVGSWTSAQPFREPPLVSWDVAVSPAGGCVAITSSLRGAFGLFLLDVKSQRVRVLHRSERVLMRPRWDVTGSRLTLIEGAPGSWSVDELSISDGTVRALYSNRRFIETAELHPDQSRLLMTIGDGPDFDGYFSGLHVYEFSRASKQLRRIGP